MLNSKHIFEEASILNRCRKSEARAQKLLFEHFAPKMLGICVLYVKDRSEAEHIMVGGMVKVLSKIDQYTAAGSLEGWIRRIMVNECLMYLKKNKVVFMEVHLENRGDIVDVSFFDTYDAEVLMLMIRSLPIGYRTVFNLYAIDGYSHAEIAKTLNIEINTSKSQLSRARALLQKKLSVLTNNQAPRTKNHEII